MPCAAESKAVMTQRQLPLGAAKRTVRVLIVDQFFGVNPYQLQKHPKTFDALVTECLNQLYPQSISYHKPEVKDVPEDFRPEYGTTVLRAGANGMAELWKYNWDSSG